MTTIFHGAGLGNVATKDTGTLSAASIPLFTIAGGRILLTGLVGEVTVAVTVANSSKLQLNPTVGAVNADICTALDIGTTDTPVGNLLAITGDPTAAMIRAAGLARLMTNGLILDEGQIEQVSAGTDGQIVWTATWLPFDEGATLVAA